MAQVQFPSSPTDGDLYTVNDVTYTWNNTAGLWEANNATALADTFVAVAGDTMTGGLNLNDGSANTIELPEITFSKGEKVFYSLRASGGSTSVNGMREEESKKK